MTNLTYRLGSRTPDELTADLADFWEAVRSDESVRQQLARLGVDPLSGDPSLREGISFSTDSMGLDASAVALIVSLAPTANKVLSDVWTECALPWIRRRRGHDAVRDPDDER